VVVTVMCLLAVALSVVLTALSSRLYKQRHLLAPSPKHAVALTRMSWFLESLSEDTSFSIILEY